jgi:lysophospholipase L1-like esterase
MKRILFQGDSVTDAGRDRESFYATGNGYARLVSAKLGFDQPGEYEFLNRGVSGNKITNLLARMKRDMINLKPDVMSILVGVNDVWHEAKRGEGNTTELFEQVYELLISEVKKACPDTRILILEPFALYVADAEGDWVQMEADLQEKAAAARRVAERNALEFVPLQIHFDNALTLAPAEYWLQDGVHPTAAGHELIAHAWIKAFESR